jgi:hypothetical protein
LAFLIRPVAGEIAPGIPTPTVALSPIVISIAVTRSTIARMEFS